MAPGLEHGLSQEIRNLLTFYNLKAVSGHCTLGEVPTQPVCQCTAACGTHAQLWALDRQAVLPGKESGQPPAEQQL